MYFTTGYPRIANPFITDQSVDRSAIGIYRLAGYYRISDLRPLRTGLHFHSKSTPPIINNQP